ncbi:MAG: hypothetical protein CVT70_01135 [Alphaproteobacteria bacterium HGW-Alphaproteobacteria-1]|jgi:hypothetical protein|nr:MAG: hypothetical protein CVT70_01135 [Alphaproteobacteria bacterium HGW-Alphaproteobacteria-1]
MIHVPCPALFRRLAALALAGTVASGPVLAADFSDPTWPCIQRKVGALSVGLMWPHPIPAGATGDAALAHEIDELAARLALRRLDPDALRPEIAAFAARHDGSPEILGRVFAQAFDTLSTRRAQVIKGIETFSLRQIALAERVKTARAEMTGLMAADSPDFDRIDALEEQIDWDQTIYSDRQTTITYLCETPVLIEQRLFALAQILQDGIRPPG